MFYAIKKYSEDSAVVVEWHICFHILKYHCYF